jgi:hypothetical protein
MYRSQLSEAKMERPSRHLEQCPECAAAVQALPIHETFPETFRSPVVPLPQPETPTAADQIARLKRVGFSVADQLSHGHAKTDLTSIPLTPIPYF